MSEPTRRDSKVYADRVKRALAAGETTPEAELKSSTYWLGVVERNAAKWPENPMAHELVDDVREQVAWLTSLVAK